MITAHQSARLKAANAMLEIARIINGDENRAPIYSLVCWSELDGRDLAKISELADRLFNNMQPK